MTCAAATKSLCSSRYSVARLARLPSSASAEMKGLDCQTTAMAQPIAPTEAANQTTMLTVRPSFRGPLGVGRGHDVVHAEHPLHLLHGVVVLLHRLRRRPPQR